MKNPIKSPSSQTLIPEKPRFSRGLLAIGMGVECLCHFDGNCFGKTLLSL